MRESTIKFEMIWNADGSDFTAVRTVFLTAGLVTLLVLDREDGEGPEGDFAITGFSRDDNQTELIKAKVVKLAVFCEGVEPASDG